MEFESTECRAIDAVVELRFVMSVLDEFPEGQPVLVRQRVLTGSAAFA
jgi:hypothetical protein